MTSGRVYLPYDLWPRPDRAAWDGLFQPGDILGDRGGAWHWAEETRRANRRHYARWLGWLSAKRRLEPVALPWTRADPETVRHYARDLREAVAPRTVASSLIGLKCTLKRMAPDADWRWLMDITNRLDAWAMPSVDRRHQILPVEQLHCGAVAELERLTGLSPLSVHARIAFRDAVIVALLAACPMRLRNLTQIQIGLHLQELRPEWRLSFAASETKTGTPLQYVVPATLVPWLLLYMNAIRPGFQPRPMCNHLWLGISGGPLAYETLYCRIRDTTHRLFGVQINPHSFRSSAATSLAEHSPEAALFARPLLGHSRPETTERYYIRAKRLEASRRINARLVALRDSGS